MQCTEEIKFYTINCPIGDLVLEVCLHGLRSVRPMNKYQARLKTNFKNRHPTILKPDDVDPCFERVINDTIHWFELYFSDPVRAQRYGAPFICFDPTLEEAILPVWKYLMYFVPPGQIINFSELARGARHKGSIKVVETAVLSNPFKIIIPCHRVVPDEGYLSPLNIFTSTHCVRLKNWLCNYERIWASGGDITMGFYKQIFNQNLNCVRPAIRVELERQKAARDEDDNQIVESGGLQLPLNTHPSPQD